MSYKIVLLKTALLHIDFLRKSGDKSSLKKIEKIISELELHPKTGVGKPEQLKYELSNYWSRRINQKDRLVYEIIEEPDKMVVIISALGY